MADGHFQAATGRVVAPAPGGTCVVRNNGANSVFYTSTKGGSYGSTLASGAQVSVSAATWFVPASGDPIVDITVV